jgi:glucokinase
MAAKPRSVEPNFVAVDVGGTKILGALADRRGVVHARERLPTPRTDNPAEIVEVIEGVLAAVLKEEGLSHRDVAAIGVAVPGVVDPKKGIVVRTPNSCLSGVQLVSHLESRFGCRVILGNDCNLGTLGEVWLGAARGAKSAMGIFVGTGIGAGFSQKKKIWRGAREVAGEIGHIVMEIGGPLCGCGNRGCFEALAGRAAIERDIREAVAKGESTLLTEILDGDLSVIRSKALKEALERSDPLVERIMRRAAEIIGYACLTVRHLLDPEWIVLGGGVMEACGDTLWPTIQAIVNSDQLPGACERGGLCLSALGDDAVVLGTVAAAARKVGINVFKSLRDIKYPPVEDCRPGTIIVNGQQYEEDVVVLSHGRVKKAGSKLANDSEAWLSEELLAMLTRGGVETVILGLGFEVRNADISKAYEFFARRRVSLLALPTPQAVLAYERSNARRSAYFCISR